MGKISLFQASAFSSHLLMILQALLFARYTNLVNSFISRMEPCFNYPTITMATWFTVIGRIAQIEGIPNSSYVQECPEF
jgi:hypothetical protein